jgi:peptide deformylase
MKLPIVAYGHPVLRKVSLQVEKDHPNLIELIADMFETMYGANGVGLAAPQIGVSLKIFVIDANPFAEDEPALKDFKKVFINPTIEEETGDKWDFNEGCLSIPHIREDVSRHPEIKISYYDENWILKQESYKGMAARVIQHEYDHILGKLFTDKINPLRKALIKGKLTNITKGLVKADYKMRFLPSKKKR